MKRYSALLAGLLCLTGCDSSTSSSTKPPVQEQPIPQPPSPPVDDKIPDAGLGLLGGLTIDRAHFLQNFGNGVALHTQEFSKASESLGTAAQAYCVDFNATSLENLRQKWAEAMMVWQQLDLYQIEPLGKDADLKNRIYGWPKVADYCMIDRESIYAWEDGDEYELPPSNFNRKGLQALEYLIFDSTLATTCPLIEPTKGLWEAMIESDRLAARCAYMLPVTADLLANARLLEKKWGPVDDNIITRQSSDPAAAQAIVQNIFTSLFYFDVEVKDKKLATPAGRNLKTCPKSPFPCPDKEELRYSQLSRQALAVNFRALADVTFGFGEPRAGGLSALLRAEGGAKAIQSERNIANLVATSEKENGKLDTLLNAKTNETCESSSISWVCQVYNGIRIAVVDFKEEYAAVLKTTVPPPPDGDND